MEVSKPLKSTGHLLSVAALSKITHHPYGDVPLASTHGNCQAFPLSHDVGKVFVSNIARGFHSEDCTPLSAMSKRQNSAHVWKDFQNHRKRFPMCVVYDIILIMQRHPIMCWLWVFVSASKALLEAFDVGYVDCRSHFDLGCLMIVQNQHRKVADMSRW
jgi:hypothetical protein